VLLLYCWWPVPWPRCDAGRSSLCGRLDFRAAGADFSLVPVISQPMAEHRMYLPLVAVVAVGVPWLYVMAGRRSVAAILLLAAGMGWLTWQRNEVYRSEWSLWNDTLAKCPDNAARITTSG